MTPAVAALNSWSDSWATLVVALVWQSTLLALVVAGICWTLRRASPAIRYWLWQIVAIKLLLIPLWTVTLPLPGFLAPTAAEDPATRQSTQASAQAARLAPTASLAGGEIPRTAAIAETARPDSPAAAGGSLRNSQPAWSALRDLTWRSWLFLAWTAIVLGQVAVVAWQWNRLLTLMRRARPAGEELTSIVASCCQRVRLDRVPRVVQVTEACSPFVCGLFRPTVVLPDTIESLVGRDQLAPILTHEVAHIRRRDLLWNWIPQLARMLFFFHPVAHWASYSTRLEAELACDAWAMAATGSTPRAYAELLVQIVTQLAEPAMLRSASVASAGINGREALIAKRSGPLA